MKTLILTMFVLGSWANATEFACNPFAKARAAAVIALQSSDHFILVDGSVPAVYKVFFAGVISQARSNDYVMDVTFGSIEAGITSHANFIISIDPENCQVGKTTLISVFP